jgi:hypothetical protein
VLEKYAESLFSSGLRTPARDTLGCAVRLGSIVIRGGGTKRRREKLGGGCYLKPVASSRMTVPCGSFAGFKTARV